MAETNQIARIYRGDSATIFVDLKRADGTPYDPAEAGVAIKYRAARSANADVRALITKELGDGISSAPGGINIELTSIDTNLRPGTYYQEIKVWDQDDVDTVMTGILVIRPALSMGTRSAPAGGSMTVSSKAPTVVRA
jgi:hypothetical protein